MKKAASIFILSAFLISCTSPLTYTDLSAQIEAKAMALDLPWERLLYVEWVNDSQIAFLLELNRQYFLGVDKYEHRLLDGELVIFDLDDNSWEEIDTESFIDCKNYRVQFVNRLPDGTIGLGAHCYYEDTPGIFGRIYQYDLASKRGQLFYTFDRHMILGELAFLDTMDTWVQENNTDAGLGNELTFVHIERGSTRLVEDFDRARSPAWLAPNMVLFFGTKSGPDEFETLEQIFAFFDTPWTLYSLDPQTGELRVLLNAVVHGKDIEEVPSSNQVAFSGNINRQDGIWTFNLDSHGLTRIWADNSMFSWSPDGSRLIVISSDGETLGYQDPMIVEYGN